jgi:hypothetical protein
MKVYQTKSGIELTLTDEQAFAYQKVSTINFLRNSEEPQVKPKEKRVTEVLQDSENVSEEKPL